MRKATLMSTSSWRALKISEIMKKNMKIGLMIIIVLIAAIIVSISAYYLWESNRCSFWNKDKCDLSCNEDSDCKGSGCTCINKDETMSFTRWGATIMVDCVQYSCKCENNKCSATRFDSE